MVECTELITLYFIISTFVVSAFYHMNLNASVFIYARVYTFPTAQSSSHYLYESNEIFGCCVKQVHCVRYR